MAISINQDIQQKVFALYLIFCEYYPNAGMSRHMPASDKRPLAAGGFLLHEIPDDKHGFVSMK
ncbi:hypothetical protein [Bacillus songklensis]|uniref:hypothetical protein n=1 Tax=Bacillus songklensis TaxID=1069116 RepID=UPI00366E14EA